MTISFIESYPNHRWIERDGQRVGELSRMETFNRLWIVEINGVRKTYASRDCFTLNNARKVARHYLTGETPKLI